MNLQKINETLIHLLNISLFVLSSKTVGGRQSLLDSFFFKIFLNVLNLSHLQTRVIIIDILKCIDELFHL